MKNKLLDLSHLGLKPPLIHVYDLEQFTESVSNTRLKQSELFIVESILSVLKANPRKYISITDVCAETGKKETTVRQYLNSIKDYGLFELAYCNATTGVVRQSKIYAFTESLKTAGRGISKQDVTDFELESINQSYIAKDKELHGKMDSLITLFLFSALQFNRKGKLKENTVNIYLQNNEMLQVKAVSKSDNVVAYVKDLRFYLAVLKLVHDIIINRIEQHKQGLIAFEDVVSTVFDIRGVDILITIGQGDGSGERNNLNLAMLRLDSTGYVIKAPEWFTEKHNLSTGVSRVDHFRIRFDAETKSKGLIYKVELEQSLVRCIYQEIVDGTSMLTFTDPQLFAIKNDFSFAFLLACQRLKLGKVTQMSWAAMKDMFAPGFSIKEFKSKLTSMLEKNVVQSSEGEKLWKVEGINKVVSVCECFYNNVSITLYEGEFQLIRSPSRKILANTLSKRNTQPFRKKIN